MPGKYNITNASNMPRKPHNCQCALNKQLAPLNSIMAETTHVHAGQEFCGSKIYLFNIKRHF